MRNVKLFKAIKIYQYPGRSYKNIRVQQYMLTDFLVIYFEFKSLWKREKV